MCLVTVLKCFMCGRFYPGVKSKTVHSSDCQPASQDVVVNKRCGYWYCEFNNKSIDLSRRIDRIEKTCGDPFCETQKCNLTSRVIDCCFSREHTRIRVIELEEAPIELVPPHSVDCYLVPCLTAPEIGEMLFDNLETADFRTFGNGGTVRFQDEFYKYLVKGDVDRIKLTVTVIRRGGDVYPQMYEGSYCRFLAFSFWKAHRASTRVDLRSYFPV